MNTTVSAISSGFPQRPMGIRCIKNVSFSTQFAKGRPNYETGTNLCHVLAPSWQQFRLFNQCRRDSIDRDALLRILASEPVNKAVHS